MSTLLFCIAVVAIYTVVTRVIRGRDGATPSSHAYWQSIGHRVGPDSAGIEIIVLFSYDCGFSAEYQPVLDSLQKLSPVGVGITYVDVGGKAGLPPSDRLLAEECIAEDGLFPQWHANGYSQLAQMTEPLGWLDVAIVSGATDVTRLRRCVNARLYAERVEHRLRAVDDLGLLSTPTTLVNGRFVEGVLNYSQLSAFVARYQPR